MVRALILTEPVMNEYLTIPEDKYNFIVDFRENVRVGLDIVFKFVSPEPYLNRALSIMQSYPNEHLQTEPWLFVVSAMLTVTNFQVDFKEVIKFIVTLPPNAPSLLIKTSCEFLRDFIDNADNRKKYSEMPEISLETMYKWLAQVPGPTAKAFLSQREPRRAIFDDPIVDFDCDVNLSLGSISKTLLFFVNSGKGSMILSDA
ncbi:hypothetical protein RF11_09546 [Thelohanellus kitauei]|uniref:Uncharacterized protein n=1 Tax=Thelohanellus kitauei TaxID=669202 RepID=A0A0C2MN89_THEKT|nr:hypothetical protein RF11_09546 [Thelohanellus kitauei]